MLFSSYSRVVVAGCFGDNCCSCKFQSEHPTGRQSEHRISIAVILSMPIAADTLVDAQRLERGISKEDEERGGGPSALGAAELYIIDFIPKFVSVGIVVPTLDGQILLVSSTVSRKSERSSNEW